MKDVAFHVLHKVLSKKTQHVNIHNEVNTKQGMLTMQADDRRHEKTQNNRGHRFLAESKPQFPANYSFGSIYN